MPVFVTWSIEPCSSPTRSRSWLTSSGVASHPIHRSPEDFTVTDVPRPFLGRPLLRPASLPMVRRPPKAASRSRKIDSSGASPAGPLQLPKEPRHCLPAEIGSLITCRTLAPLPALGEAGTAVPITKSPCTCPPSRKSEKLGKKPVDNGDIGNNRSSRVTIPRLRRESRRFGCCSVPLRLLRPSA
jgi:hypothetical protein